MPKVPTAAAQVVFVHTANSGRVRVSKARVDELRKHGVTIARLRAEKRALEVAYEAAERALEQSWALFTGDDEDYRVYEANCAVINNAAWDLRDRVSTVVAVTTTTS